MTAELKPGIIVRRLTKRIGRKCILEDVDFSIQPAQIAAVIGPNGSGKTTLLRILATLMRPSDGDIRVAGYPLPEEAVLARTHIGVVLHQPLLYSDLTARENLVFHARLHNRENSDHQISQLLQRVGLAGREDDLVRTFSRGMQQRLAIARAILTNPDILLLDEPFTGLDSEGIVTLTVILKQMADRGAAILLSSHDIPGVEMLATRFLILNKGKMQVSIGKSELSENGLLSVYQKSFPPAGEAQ